MEIEGWRYYNHAAVPTCLLDESPNLQPLEDGSIWRLTAKNGGGKNPLLAKYDTNFDCAEETSFWYIIKDGPFVLEELSQKQRHHIRTAQKRCRVEKIVAAEHADELYEVYHAAYSNYDQPDNERSRENFNGRYLHSTEDCWAAFSTENGAMVGFMFCKNMGRYSETVMAKYHPAFQKLQPSNAIHVVVLDYYLNTLGQKFVCSGSRNIKHKTNVQDYKLQHWKFRKAYCHLHVVVNPRFRWAVRLAYSVRGVLLLLDRIPKIHQLNSMLSLYGLSVEYQTRK